MSELMDGPDPDAKAVSESGSSSSSTSLDMPPPQVQHNDVPPWEPPLVRDIGRIIIVALLVSASIGSPTAFPIFAPFAASLVALRLIRRWSWTFVASCIVVGAAAAAGATATLLPPAWVAATALAGSVLAAGLGTVHAIAARKYAIAAQPGVSQPEPHVLDGFMLTVWAWALAILIALTVAYAALGNDRIESLGRDVVNATYQPYTDNCVPGGLLARSPELCEQADTQRRQVLGNVSTRAAAMLAAISAIVALASAITAHMLVCWRGRKVALHIRPSVPLRDMEVHWTSAYVATVGMLIAVLVTGGFVAESMWVNAAATWCIALGAGLIIIDGLGLLTWLLDRVKAPRWYRVVLVIGAVLFSPAAAAVLGVIGIVDIALRPRRRSSGTLTRRD